MPPVDSIINTAEEYFKIWQDDFTRMADAVVGRKATESLSDVLDIDAAVNYFLVYCIAGNEELCHPKSVFIYKKSLDEGEVYHLGPVWDFDWAFTYAVDENASPTRPLLAGDGDYAGATLFKCIFANQEFKERFKAKFEEFYYDGGYDSLKAFMEEYATLIEPTSVENGVLWPECDDTIGSYEFRKNFEALKDWIDRRLIYMSTHVNFGLY